MKREIIIGNQYKKGTFPVTKFIEKAKKFSSSIKIQKDELEIDGSSLLGMLSLKLSSGMKIILITTGKDEKKAMDELINFLT